MHWNINSGGAVIGSGSATDADEDMAYALIKANQKWPGSGFDVDAKKLVNAIKATEVVSGNYINPGDNWGNTQIMNPSYIAPSYYRAFAALTGDSQWTTIADTNSAWLVRAADSKTGLLPDWLNADLSPANIGWDSHSHDFWFDAARTPIRLLMYYKSDNDVNAHDILQKQSAFFDSVGTSKLMSGYSLVGSPLSGYIDSTFLSGYAASGQVNPTTTYAQNMLNSLIANSPAGYFGTSLRALTLFIVSQAN